MGTGLLGAPEPSCRGAQVPTRSSWQTAMLANGSGAAHLAPHMLVRSQAPSCSARASRLRHCGVCGRADSGA
jgi:hypothetical protein